MTTLGERRGPYAKGTAQREAILRLALEYFGQYGYHGVSMREIAREVGLSQAGLLHHFASKEDLLFAILDARDTLTATVVESEGDGNPLEQVLAIVRDNTGHRQLVQMFAVVSAEATDESHPGHDFFRGRQEAVIGWFTERFAAAIEQGLAHPDLDPLVAGRLCQATMYGLQVQWLLDPSTDILGLFRTFLDTLVHTAGADAPGDGPEPLPPNVHRLRPG